MVSPPALGAPLRGGEDVCKIPSWEGQGWVNPGHGQIFYGSGSSVVVAIYKPPRPGGTPPRRGRCLQNPLLGGQGWVNLGHGQVFYGSGSSVVAAITHPALGAPLRGGEEGRVIPSWEGQGWVNLGHGQVFYGSGSSAVAAITHPALGASHR